MQRWTRLSRNAAVSAAGPAASRAAEGAWRRDAAKPAGETPALRSSAHRGAIVGAGNVAVNGHMPSWNAMIVAGVESDAARRAEVAAMLPDIHWVDSLDHVRDVDFVDICTPPSTHAALIKHALRRGFHVLCEKPLVTRGDDFEEIAGLAESLDRVVYTVDNWRNAPILARATSLIREGAIGEVRRVKWVVLRNGPSATIGSGNWRLDAEIAGGGIAVDHGWHAVYVLHDWIGTPPSSVRGTLESRLTLPGAAQPSSLRPRLEDTALLEIDYPRASAEIFLTWAADERRNLATIEGTRGTMHIDGDRLEVNGVESRCEPSLTAGSHHAEWFPGVIERFFAEIDNPSLRGRNLDVAAICMNVLAAARQAEEITT